MNLPIVQANEKEILSMIKRGFSANQIKRKFGFSMIKNIKNLAEKNGILDVLVDNGKNRQKRSNPLCRKGIDFE